MLTEHEMKEFFQNVVDQVATLSTQASRVEGLEQRIQELNNRLNALEAENQALRHQVNETASKAREVQDNLSVTQNMLENERAVVVGLRDTLVSRDTKVQEVENTLSNEKDAHRITVSERDDARYANQELTNQVNSFRDLYQQADTRASEWESKAHKYEQEAASLKQQLDRIYAVLNPIHAVPATSVA